ncbi:hypothetical protein FLK61_37925 [Paenalkalicoccus suaedae]|uniref:Membrane protein NfeD2 N-terminal transmembrane domain-containing protein n=1 Tax=Paenalkalicoccus suaedae TaxID=2592382 RepID=A0A859FH09_9BACI|nr:hypothetical protein [Paenalkalicoccus suaedae]QKS72409.1 hypothetical protein FLK61_37925 [Paenalkalicoccus suaedae]
MEIAGIPITTIYLTLLVVGVALTILYIFVGEVLEGILDIGDGAINPVTAIGFVTLLGGAGYILELVLPISSGLVLGLAFILSSILIVLVNYFIILPVKRSEKNMSFSIRDLIGRVGEVYTSVPAHGYGEVIIRRTHGTISKPAKSFDDVPLPEGTKVLIVDIDEEGVFLVSEYEEE